MAKYEYSASRPMRIQARQGSRAERLYYAKSALPSGPWPSPKAIAPGIDPSPLDDLIFHGGKTVPQMEFQNVYLGGDASWKASDIASIDQAITLAMQDARMNNVMVQYFPGAKLSCDPRDSLIHTDPKPQRIDESDVQAIVSGLFKEGSLKKTSLDSTIFNLILPSGTVLALEDANSQNGLGGYHGSMHVTSGGQKVTLYYSANVFSEIKNGQENGIAEFDQPWKNVVATLYHEINEFRTDADINDAIEKNDDDFLGWTSRKGNEVGDQPIFVAGDLHKVFKEVTNAQGTKRFPVQFLYSNAVHGAEGPIAQPHVSASAIAKARSLKGRRR